MNNMLNILALDLAQISGLDGVICRGILRLTIMDITPGFENLQDFTLVFNHLAQMNYADWQRVLGHEVLIRRIKNMGVKNPADIIEKLKQSLVAKQSLLTLSTR